MRALDLFSAAAGGWTPGLRHAGQGHRGTATPDVPLMFRRSIIPIVAAPRARTGCLPSMHHADSLTHVELTHIEKHVENWIRFGRHVGERIIDRRRRVLSFRPGSVFAFVRWAANNYGTVASRIDIVRAVDPGEPYQTLPFVRPGGDILLHVEGWPKVERVLRHMDTVEAAGVDPCDAAPDHWRHVHNRIATGDEPRGYTVGRHRAWLKRREIER